MPRRRDQSSLTSRVFSIMLCVVIPVGIAALLIAATVMRFNPTAQSGACIAGADTKRTGQCTPSVVNGVVHYKLVMRNMGFISETGTELQSCTFFNSYGSSSQQCQEQLDEWEPGYSNECWRSDARSWWLAPHKPECYFDDPQRVDTFDKTLPLTCAAALLMGAGCFWAPKIKRWSEVRSRRRRRARQNQQPVERSSVPAVVRHGTVDLFTVTAVWTGKDSAAVIVGNAGKGAYPCEVQKVFDVGTTADGECVVCLEYPKAVVMWPCRHLCACADCAPKLKRCPICRTPIRRRLCLELTQLDGEDGAGGGEPLREDASLDSTSEDSEKDEPWPGQAGLEFSDRRISVASIRRSGPGPRNASLASIPRPALSSSMARPSNPSRHGTFTLLRSPQLSTSSSPANNNLTAPSDTSPISLPAGTAGNTGYGSMLLSTIRQDDSSRV
ncbi:putative E3 ubiquitin-protein ligase LOG2 [Diplonema papillatum]|nr:putative E3 ubiquitin-protein ligase LOG2 [Diplonema papillatum]